MNDLAFCSISALDRSLAAAAEVAAGAGLMGLEVTARPPHLAPDVSLEDAKVAGDAVRAAGVSVVAYGSYLGREGETEISQAEHAARVAGALETALLRVWAEPMEGDSLAPVVAWLRAACDVAADLGVVVVAERHIGSLVDTPERIAGLFEAVERENLALNYQVLDFLPSDAIPHQAADAAALIGRARYMHLKNYRLNIDPNGPLFPGGSLALGALDYRKILGAVVEAGYEGPMTFEFLAHEDLPVEAKLAKDVAFVREVLAEAHIGGARSS